MSNNNGKVIPSYLQLVIDNGPVTKPTRRGGARPALSSASTTHSSSSSAATALACSPVRLACTAESIEIAANLVDAYHRERQTTPFRSVIRVEVGEHIDRDNLELAVNELDLQGWTITPVGLDDDLKTARALWLRPYS